MPGAFMAVGSMGAEAVSRGIGRVLAGLVFSRSLTLVIVGAAELFAAIHNSFPRYDRLGSPIRFSEDSTRIGT